MTEKLHPVLVQQTAEMIHVLKLGPKTETGAYGIPEGRMYTHVGEVVSLTEQVPDRRRKGRMRRETSWFAYTRAETRVGPFPSRPKAVAGLLTQLGLVQVKGTDTMEPLF